MVSLGRACTCMIHETKIIGASEASPLPIVINVAILSVCIIMCLYMDWHDSCFWDSCMNFYMNYCACVQLAIIIPYN